MKRNNYSIKKNDRIQNSILTIPLALCLLFLNFLLAGCIKHPEPPLPPHSLDKINHVVVIYLENHSFDNLYGEFPGANGLSNASASKIIQVDSAGHPYATLPPVPGTTAFPTNLANNYFNIDQYVPNDMMTPDVLHRYYQEQMQIDGGRMDKYALYNTTAGLSQGYYKTSLLPLLSIAEKYTLCDNFFHSAFGGSFLNHQWLIAAASPVFPNAPASMVAQLDASGKLIKDGAVTPDGFVVNTTFL